VAYFIYRPSAWLYYGINHKNNHSQYETQILNWNFANNGKCTAQLAITFDSVLLLLVFFSLLHFQIKIYKWKVISCPTQVDLFWGGGRKSTALFTPYALVAVTMRVFILLCIVYSCSCCYAIVTLLSRKSQEMARTMPLSYVSQHALSHTCYAVETGANFLESLWPFRNSEQTFCSCETNPSGERQFKSLYVSILTPTACCLFYGM
jgi:hypothetical protein